MTRTTEDSPMTQTVDSGRPALPTIGAFTTAEPLIIEMFPNGGWVVFQFVQADVAPNSLGAYSTAQEMLDALGSALIGGAS